MWLTAADAHTNSPCFLMEGGSPMCGCMLIDLFDLVKKKYLYDVFFLCFVLCLLKISHR